MILFINNANVSNYRPVRLTSIICKIFERTLKKDLLSFLSETRAISPHLHGTLLRRPCISILPVLEEAVASMMDEGHTVFLIYLDFVKAFVSVSHKCLLAKIKPFVLDDIVVRLIETCIFGRVSILKLGGEHSEAISIRSCVPQGSVIDPLFFFLFENGLPGVLEALVARYS